MTETAVENEQAEQVVQAPCSAVSDERLVAKLAETHAGRLAVTLPGGTGLATPTPAAAPARQQITPQPRPRVAAPGQATPRGPRISP